MLFRVTENQITEKDESEVKHKGNKISKNLHYEVNLVCAINFKNGASFIFLKKKIHCDMTKFSNQALHSYKICSMHKRLLK